MSYFNYCRRKSSEVAIGHTPLGGDNPLRIQSMTNTSTLDTASSVEQCIRIIDAGADYVRLTAQGEREARNLGEIRRELDRRGYRTPLIADIHFNPKAAYEAARQVEKVRINPGNFVDSARTFKKIEFTDQEYAQEIEKIRQRFVPFLDICRQHGTAIRIGVNHGSLSDRIMSRYGDTPEGMVESCLEFLRICQSEDFRNVVISIKASNTGVMVRTVRLLVREMKREQMHYPLHLGVTEAGDGEEGRIKSAVGIGALLADGIGDTIRVSLSESPEAEIPVARQLASYIARRSGHAPIDGQLAPGYDYCNPQRRISRKVGIIGGGQAPVVVAPAGASGGESQPDFRLLPTGQLTDGTATYPLRRLGEPDPITPPDAPHFLLLDCNELTSQAAARIRALPDAVLVVRTSHPNCVGEWRMFFHRAMLFGVENPVILTQEYDESDEESLQLKAAADFGALFLDGFGDGIWIQNRQPARIDTARTAFAILQAVRLRITRTEYISCPGCGRTLFNLQETIARIKAATQGQTGLKIGIMGCIVNGPGEMADADYGYVGAGRGKVSLYKGKTCVEQHIDESLAVAKLIELIRANGDWKA